MRGSDDKGSDDDSGRSWRIDEYFGKCRDEDFAEEEEYNRAIVQVLLEKGAKISAKGSRHHNALRAATAGKGYKIIFHLLLENKARAENNSDSETFSEDSQYSFVKGGRSIYQESQK